MGRHADCVVRVRYRVLVSQSLTEDESVLTDLVGQSQSATGALQA